MRYQTQNQIKKMMYFFELQNFKRNHFVYHQGDAATAVYIVVDGDFEITRTKRSTSYGKGIFDDERARGYIGPRYQNVGVKAGAADGSKNKNFAIEKKRAREEIKLALASKGFIFG
jgi:CRP-like cAMP-binding protein